MYKIIKLIVKGVGGEYICDLEFVEGILKEIGK